MIPMLITEELFLLLCDDYGTLEHGRARSRCGLISAVISDLILAEKLQVSDHNNPRITVVPDAAAKNPVLDTTLERLRPEVHTKVTTLVTDNDFNPEHEVARSLADAGVVRVEEKRLLGLIPERYPVVSAEPERSLRQQLAAVLAGDTPRSQDETLLSILQGLDVAHTVLEDEKAGRNRWKLKSRIEEISEETIAGHAVARAIQSMNAAIINAAILPAATSD